MLLFYNLLNKMRICCLKATFKLSEAMHDGLGLLQNWDTLCKTNDNSENKISPKTNYEHNGKS